MSRLHCSYYDHLDPCTDPDHLELRLIDSYSIYTLTLITLSNL